MICLLPLNNSKRICLITLNNRMICSKNPSVILCQKPAKSAFFLHISLIFDRKREGSMQQFAAFFAFIYPRNAFFSFRGRS